MSRSLDLVVDASSVWPGPPGLQDDDRLGDALLELSRASDGLAAAWRGETATPPPAPPSLPAAADPAGGADPLQEHRDLLDQARPFSRVDHRPYDPDLRARLAEAATAAAALPPVMSTLGIDLTAVCRLAAAVAKNADDAALEHAVEADSQRRPVCAALLLIEETGRMAEERGREVPQHARDAFVRVWDSVDWSDPDAWADNDCYGAAVFWTASHRTSPDAVKDRLAGALSARPDVVLLLVTATAGWTEVLDAFDQAVRALVRTHRDLPPWFPAEAAAEAAASAAPHVLPVAPDAGSGDGPEPLLEQVLWLIGQAAR